MTIAGPTDFVVLPGRVSKTIGRVRAGRLRPNIGAVSSLHDAVAAFDPTRRIDGRTIIRVRP